MKFYKTKSSIAYDDFHDKMDSLGFSFSSHEEVRQTFRSGDSVMEWEILTTGEPVIQELYLTNGTKAQIEALDLVEGF